MVSVQNDSFSDTNAPEAFVMEGLQIPRVWTREAAINWALEHNNRIIDAHASLEQQTGRMWGMRARLLPRLSARANLSSRQESLIDRSPAELLVPADQQTAIAAQGYDGVIEVRQLLFDGMSAWSQYESGNASVEEALWMERDIILRVVNEVHQLYDQLLASSKAIAILGQALELRRQLLDLTRSRLQAGAAVEYEVLRAEAEFARAEGALAEGMANWKRAWQGFVEALQLPAEVARLSADLVELEGDFEAVKWNLDVNEALDQAMSKNRRIMASNLRLESATLAVRATRRTAWPRIEGFANYTNRSSFYSFDDNLDGFVVGVSATWDIFDGFARQGEVLARLGERRRAENDLRATKLTIEQTILTSYSVLESARVAMEAEERAVAFSQKGYEQALRLYEVGSLNFQDVIDAQVVWETSQLGLLDAITQFNNSVYQIRYLAAMPEGADASALTPDELARDAEVGILNPARF